MSKLSKLRRAIIKGPEAFYNESKNNSSYFDKGAQVYRVRGKLKIGYITHHEQAHKAFIKHVLSEIRRTKVNPIGDGINLEN